ncbi:MAG: 3-isopropylmalate dehydrogenase [Dehalococcoidia bacterium]|nr:3-isopropylmalate dehydrogenase [Dehalococcoidia bacterium]
MNIKIAVLSGDGIGPEVIAEALKVLEMVGQYTCHEFSLTHGLVGGEAIERTGSALPDETLALARASDAVLFGAVGDPKFDDPGLKMRPEDGLLALRKELGLFANLRPVMVYDELVDGAIFKPDIIRGADFIFVRELTGGLYFGQPKKRWTVPEGRRAVDSMAYSEQEIERLVRLGFELARARRRKLTSVDKANVLESSRLWREVTNDVARDYPEVALEHMLVDTCAMRILLTPRDFDVLVTENTFGDILTDEASLLAGSMGMLPSASLAGVPREVERAFGLYEPIHGSAPAIAGKDIANPIATILTLAMMLRYSCALPEEAGLVERAVARVLKMGYRTGDIMSEGKKQVGTKEMGDIIVREIAA